MRIDPIMNFRQNCITKKSKDINFTSYSKRPIDNKLTNVYGVEDALATSLEAITIQRIINLIPVSGISLAQRNTITLERNKNTAKKLEKATPSEFLKMLDNMKIYANVKEMSKVFEKSGYNVAIEKNVYSVNNKNLPAYVLVFPKKDETNPLYLHHLMLDVLENSQDVEQSQKIILVDKKYWMPMINFIKNNSIDNVYDKYSQNNQILVVDTAKELNQLLNKNL